MTLILCGHKSCGKTTLARAYSQIFNSNFIDTDTLIIQAAQPHYPNTILTPQALYQAIGPAKFRQLEAAVIQTIQPPLPRTIIALGGGTLLHIESMSYLRSLGHIVYLRMSQKQLQRRWAALGRASHKKWIKMLNYDIDQREVIYQKAAHVVIDVDNQPVETLVRAIHQLKYC